MTWTPKVVDLPDAALVVVGAGSAGCVAAIAAARALGHGKVTLVERYGFLGGSSTGVLDTFYGFFTPGAEPRKIVGGIPDEVVDRLVLSGNAFLRPNTYGAGTGVTYNPESLKRAWDELTEDAGVKTLHHALVVDVETAGDFSIRAAIIATKSGLFRIKAQRWIDASGDADLCQWAGVAYEKAGDLDPAQTLTTTFRMANVDLSRFESEGGKRMLQDLMAAAPELPRKKGSAHAMAIEGCIATVAVRVADIDATDFRQLGAAEAEGRRQAFVFERFFRDRVPGYERARIIGLATGIGVRETRRVYGEARLSRADCLEVLRAHDRVFLCGAPIEDHRMGEEETEWAYVPGGQAYDVPYGTLVPKGRDDLWAVGRCFSATHDAHASCRSMAQTMSSGQAAGVAAALSIKADTGARDIPIHRLQDDLRRLGAVLETPPDSVATEVWSLR